MSSSSQQDMFSMASSTGALTLHLRGIALAANKSRKDQIRKTQKVLPPNCHVPSFKNSKMWILKDPRGKPLRRPLLITKPEFQQWMAKAGQHLESQLLCMCREAGATRLELSKLFATLSRLPVDDSWKDYPEGSWKVVQCQPGEEGATIVIERLS